MKHLEIRLLEGLIALFMLAVGFVGLRAAWALFAGPYIVNGVRVWRLIDTVCASSACLGIVPVLIASGALLSVCERVARNEPFCEENVRALRRIEVCGAAVLAVCALAFLLYIVYGAQDQMMARVMAWASVGIALGASAVALCARVLSALVGRARALLLENELTI